jgi:SAM-dependent methyltransferase
VQGDAFALPFDAEFDLVYAFRLIRHFGEADRAQLYAELARVLKPGGFLVFDAVNAVVSAPLRANASPGEYSHFDALLTPRAVREEVVRHGFSVESLAGVQHRYGLLLSLQTLLAPRAPGLAGLAMDMVDRVGRGEPLEWIVTCRRV